ncbi:hypothetical protein BDA99DRAFT_544280 [Phascolomyces articulosus]|uniref:Uncharacterized protein n=1 Tax=Phascolomyces articulosus TaxID=60185 RepID=A0AAD5JX66_9FUNG|nr:hypothetical protein BDA99DRAFT_544280 [Phascolomyces articulosus]
MEVHWFWWMCRIIKCDRIFIFWYTQFTTRAPQTTSLIVRVVFPSLSFVLMSVRQLSLWCLCSFFGTFMERSVLLLFVCSHFFFSVSYPRLIVVRGRYTCLRMAPVGYEGTMIAPRH